MQLIQHTLAFRIPGTDAVVQTGLYPGEKRPEPVRIAADAPIPIYLDDAAKLTVAGRMETVIVGALDGQGRPEILVSLFILGNEEFRFAK